MTGIAEEDQVALYTYLTRYHRRIDAALRSVDSAELAALDAHIRVATFGLAQLPRYEGTVYRGATLPESALRAYVPGTMVREPAFVVASADPALVFAGNVRYVIHSVNGRDVASVSDDPAMRPVMFFAGTRFKVLAVEAGPPPGTHAVYLTEVPDPRLARA